MKRVVLVSGMSGAGKSSVMSVLEDMGYHCIDQYPVQLLTLLLDLIESTTDPRFNFIALSTSAKDFPEYRNMLRGSEFDVRVVFLDAANDVLLRRYKSTRRTHPLLINHICNSLEDAIETEREMFVNYKDASFLTIDTSFLNNNTLKSRIETYLAINNTPSFSITFESFGYKHGVPLDADLMIDVRFLPNPYWEVELRPYNGNDECVYNYVMEKEETKEFIPVLVTFLDYAFKQYVKEGKNHLTVGIGCTGGQHRSVTITNYLFDYYSKQYHCFKEHRDA
ncbi:MAG: RNase adapter RapZ [Erysipelotrichaceae bacterium]|nr:RNase adapter RapZ [Erysipelotrichaceae bacterium]